MGENYKLKPPVKEFLIRLAREHPDLGCRKMVFLINEEFKADISKSSVNSLLKSLGLSQAVGRRRSIAKPAISPQPLLPPCIIPAAQGSNRQEGQVPLGFYQQALGMKFILKDNSYFFIDAACCSIWSSRHIPADFGAAINSVRDFLQGLLERNEPLVLLSPGGSQEPPAELLNFIEGFQADNPVKAIRAIELYGNKNEVMEAMNAIPAGRHYFVLGIWPWQYAGHSAITALRAISYRKNGRDILTLVTNLQAEDWDDERITRLYLQRWPDPESQYQEFLNKVIKI